MGAHARLVVVEDRPHVQIDRLDRTEGALDMGQALVGRHRGIGIELRGGQAGAHHVQAVQRGLGLDRLGLARVAQRRLGDRELEVLGHVEVPDHAPHAQGDGVPAAQRAARALGGRRDLGQIGLGGGQQLQPLARALLGQQGVATHHQTLAGEVLTGQLQQVALVEQRGLERPVFFGQLRDLRGAQ